MRSKCLDSSANTLTCRRTDLSRRTQRRIQWRVKRRKWLGAEHSGLTRLVDKTPHVPKPRCSRLLRRRARASSFEWGVLRACPQPSADAASAVAGPALPAGSRPFELPRGGNCTASASCGRWGGAGAVCHRALIGPRGSLAARPGTLVLHGVLAGAILMALPASPRGEWYLRTQEAARHARLGASR